MVIAVVAGLWLGNLLDWAGYTSPLPRFNKTEVVTEVEAEAVVEEITPEAAPEATPAE